jgi:hypothetical protein
LWCISYLMRINEKKNRYISVREIVKILAGIDGGLAIATGATNTEVLHQHKLYWSEN